MQSSDNRLSPAEIELLAHVPEGACQRIDLEGGRNLIALRRQGSLRVFLNRCPHRGIELDWIPGAFLAADGHHLQCATHGALFDPETGICISGPCAGESLQIIGRAPGQPAGA